jgi:hypothetical protein
MEGNDCYTPIYVPIDNPWDEYTRTDQTCGRGNFADNTCLGYYDGGEDIFFEIEIAMLGIYLFKLDPHGTSWTGMALSTDCPPSGSDPDDCIAISTSSDYDPHSFIVTLEPGTYYLMIDTWPAPDCISEFTLYIYEGLHEDWGTCHWPISMELPSQAPYWDSAGTTCGYWDDYNNSCLGNWDGGDDLIYALWVERPGNVNIRLQPKGTGYTALALDDSCPPDNNCLATSTSISAEPHGIEINLEEGVYYLIVDTWPLPECIPEYDLSVAFAVQKICGDVNDDFEINVSDAVYLVNYIFVGGDPPVIPRSGDVNCDTYTNISDAVLIINFIFIGGNTPCDLDGDDIPDC